MVARSSFEDYLASENLSIDAQAVERVDRDERLLRFPYSVILKLSYPELDFANRCCWQGLGPCDGECLERFSEYRTCELTEAHLHKGKWTWQWLAKTDYNFGFSEWCFAERSDYEWFAANVEKIDRGEHHSE